MEPSGRPRSVVGSGHLSELPFALLFEPEVEEELLLEPELLPVSEPEPVEVFSPLVVAAPDVAGVVPVAVSAEPGRERPR